MAAADNTPDFDSMSPEEIMAWMESLAKRQGAKSEELTTSADIEIPEIDPDTVVIDEPGYVPYGEDRPERPDIPAIPSAPPAPTYPAAAPARPAAFEPPAPAATPEPAWRSVVPSPQPDRLSAKPLPPEPPSPPVAEPVASPLDNDAMAWLESLAADQGDALFNLDLNALTDEIEHRAPSVADEPTDPMAWLRSLANEDDVPAPASPPPAPTVPESQADTEAVADPFASGVDPMAWLENLARRQGARDEELTTSTEMNIPVPENPVVEEPGYKPFSFDTLVEPHRHVVSEPEEAVTLENPSSWLESLADSQGFDAAQIVPEPEAADEPLDVDQIEQAIADGTVTPEQMQAYLELQTDVYVESLEQQADFEGEAPPVPAELPDWLLEQMGPPQLNEESQPLSHFPPLTDAITEPPPATDLPDWLQEDLPTEDELDFDSIFANTTEEEFVAPDSGDFEGLTLNIDQTDPWVEAFDLEQMGGSASLDAPPDWYLRNLNDPERIAAVEQTGDEEGALAEARLPEETELPEGELMAVPDWLSAPPAAPVDVEADTSDDMPDWLRELEADVEPDSIPDWLIETMDEGYPEVEADLPAAPEPEPAPVAAAPPPEIPASEALAEARQKVSTGQVAVALETYESLVRSSHELEQVVSDLQSLVRQHRTNPAVYRVLGDGLMRQGKLQSALDTYREALNLL